VSSQGIRQKGNVGDMKMGTPDLRLGSSPLRAIGAVLISLACAACSASGASPSASVAETGTSPAAATASPAATGAPTPTQPAAATLPSGAWTSIRWTAFSSQDPVFGPAADQTDPNKMDSGWVIVAWSGGYLAFDTVTTTPGSGPWTWTTSTRHSTDGLDWTAGDTITLTGQQGTSAPGDLSGGGVVESGGVLLAVAGNVVVCGNVPDYLTPVADSSDGGATWKTVTPDLGSIQHLSGGPSGMIATGEAGVFTSKDGAAWTRASLSGSAFKGLDQIDDGVSMTGGYVISGETFGPQEEGCGAGRQLLSPSLWWSPDGTTWTKDGFSDGLTGTDLSMDVCVATDKVTVATETSNDTQVSWSSSDGQTWQTVPSGSPVSCDWARDITRVGDRYLHVGQNDDGTTTISLVGDDLSLTTLPQTGDVPAWDSMYGPFVGPAGLVATDQQGHVYLGVPAGN